ncbi:TPA: short-chain dehydrogenase, partial [Stenotrophomonas maltophilia]
MAGGGFPLTRHASMITHQNKIALVTGATRGIGLETVR